MPGGFSGGAQGFGRFYRNAALTIQDTETTIALDADSVLAPLIQVERSSGDIKSLIAGVMVCTIEITVAASLSAQEIALRAYHVLPNTTETLISVTYVYVPASSGPLTYRCIAACSLDVDNLVRFTAQCSSGTRDIEVGDENGTWAYVVIG